MITLLLTALIVLALARADHFNSDFRMAFVPPDCQGRECHQEPKK